MADQFKTGRSWRPSCASTAFAAPRRPARDIRPRRMSAADLMAVLLASTCATTGPSRTSQQRPPDLQQGPRLPAALRHVQGGRRDHRRGAADAAQVRQPARRPSQPARAPLGRRGHRLARAGPAHRRRHGAQRQVPRQAALPRLGAARRQRDGRRLHLGGVRQGVALQAQQPDRHPGHEPAGPARRDRPGLEQRRLRRPGAGLRLARHRAGRPRLPADRHGLRRGADAEGQADRASSPRPRRGTASRSWPTRTAGTARRSTPTRRRQAIAELGGERHIIVKTPQAGSDRSPRRVPAAQPLQAADLPGRRQGGDAQGLRRRAGGPGRHPARRGGAGRRGVQLDPRRRVQEGLSRPLLRDVHRRAAARSARRWAWRVLGKRAFASTFAAFFTRAYDQIRMAADLQRHHPPVRLPRRRQHRRGRALADGAGRPGDDARRLRQHRALPVRRQPDGAPGQQMADLKGISFLRTTREKTPVLYAAGEKFPVGGSKVRQRIRTRTRSP